MEIIAPQVKVLAQKICSEIIKYNGKSPSAVFLVGGSSNLPNLPEEIASILNLPINRVSVRDIKSVEILDYKGKTLKGPESITPIGIAYSAMINKRKDFIKVSIDNETIKIFNIKNPTVMDALVAINYDSKNLIVQNGKDLVFNLNGQRIVVKGEEGTPPKIYVNDSLANLKTPIKDGDEITIIKGQKGQDATITAGELLKQQKGKIIFVNDSKVDQNYVIKNGDEIVIKEDLTSFVVTVNGKEVVLKGKEEYLFVDVFNFIDLKLDNNKVPEMKLNGRRASYTDILKPGDNIEIEI
nr:hypothetical protein [Thermoanaerobacter siderophilus]